MRPAPCALVFSRFPFIVFSFRSTGFTTTVFGLDVDIRVVFRD